MHMRIFRNCYLLFRPHLNLPRYVVLLCFTSFHVNNISYCWVHNERELNNLMWCFVNMQRSCILSSTWFVGLFVHFAMPCIFKPDMHHTWLCIMPCLCVGCLLCCVLLFRCCFFVDPSWVEPCVDSRNLYPLWVEPCVDSRNRYPLWVEVSINVDVG